MTVKAYTYNVSHRPRGVFGGTGVLALPNIGCGAVGAAAGCLPDGPPAVVCALAGDRAVVDFLGGWGVRVEVVAEDGMIGGIVYVIWLVKERLSGW